MSSNFRAKFTESDVIRSLESRGLKWQDRGKYLFIQCPRHDDQHPSAQLFKDTWTVHCHAGCGRYFIQHEFPELDAIQQGKPIEEVAKVMPISKEEDKSSYKDYNLLQFWESLPLITNEYTIKNFTADQMNAMGWRLHLNESKYFKEPGIFIPYFSTSGKQIPFAQLRHFDGSQRRFSFLRDARIILYNFPALKRSYIMLVEGSSDVLTLKNLGYDAVGLPSASQNKILEKLVEFSKKNNKPIVYLGDNDRAGQAVYDFLEQHAYFYPITHGKYKDVSDLYQYGKEADVERLKYDLENIIHRLKREEAYRRIREQEEETY